VEDNGFADCNGYWPHVLCTILSIMNKMLIILFLVSLSLGTK